MAVYLAASDETVGEGIFHHAGYVASIDCWNEVFVPAWKRDVLTGKPRLSTFHMNDLRSERWRQRQGMTRDDVEARIDAAVDVLSRTEGLFAVWSSIDKADFDKNAYRLGLEPNDPRRGRTKFEVDYLSFNWYAHHVLRYCSSNPAVERVDFMIEKKEVVFPTMEQFHAGLPTAFMGTQSPHFAQMVGELQSGGKEEIRLQAADVLCWHVQRKCANARNPKIAFSEVDRKRFDAHTRRGASFTMGREMVEDLRSVLQMEAAKMKTRRLIQLSRSPGRLKGALDGDASSG
ncbi:MAG: hypothetical protein ACLGQX_04415 [Acidobacteriota bacterium]